MRWLADHRPPRGSVTAGYVDLSMEYLTECQERVSRFIMQRTKAKEPAGKKSKRPGARARAV